MATHSSVLAWKIPQTEEPGGLWPTGHRASGATECLHSHSPPAASRVSQHMSELTLAVSVSREQQAAYLRQQMLVSPAPGSWKSETVQGDSFVGVLVRAFLLVCRHTASLVLVSCCCHGTDVITGAPPSGLHLIHVTLGYHHVEL